MAFDIHRTQQIVDIIHGTIRYSGIESAIISTPIFNRLHRILQSSMVYLTYSSNKVKRFEHSVGTMHLAGKMFYYSFVNTTNKEVLDGILREFKTEILRWCSRVDFIGHPFLTTEDGDRYSTKQKQKDILKASVPNCALYRELTPSSLTSEDNFAFLVFLQAVRMAALLHDVGHLPYSHIFEDAIRNLYLRVSNIPDKKRTVNQIRFLRVISCYYDGEGQKDEVHAIHERIGKALFLQIKTSVADKISAHELNGERIFLALVFDLAEKILQSTPMDNDIFSDLHWLISGTVDADRLDYCSRDLFCSGLSKDVYPYDRLLCTYKIMRHGLNMDITDNKKGLKNVREHFLFCPEVKCVPEVEALLERRNLIFSQINYHHRVHKHEILFSIVLSDIGFHELEAEEELSGLETSRALPPLFSSIWMLIEELQRGRTLIDYLVIQMDDSWMDVVLKNAFFNKYQDSFRDMRKNGLKPEWNRFDELISATKRYSSCFKRLADFREFDLKFCTKLEKELKNCDATQFESIEKNAIRALMQQIERYKSKNGQDVLIFNLWLSQFVPETPELYRCIEQELNKNLKKQKYQNIGVRDCLVRSCRFGLGLDTSRNPIMFWTRNSDTPMTIEAYSIQHQIFIEKRKFSPSFHLYYLPFYDSDMKTYKKVNEKQLLELLAEVAAKLMREYFEKAKSDREKLVKEMVKEMSEKT